MSFETSWSYEAATWTRSVLKIERKTENYLTASLRHIGTDFLAPVLALLDEDGAALLGVPLLPHHGLVGGDVHTELLQTTHNVTRTLLN